MLNIIITILIFPFLPFFMYGNLMNNTSQNLLKRSQVLGETSTQQNKNNLYSADESKDFQNHNFFLLDRVDGAEFTPIRKADFSDIKIWSRASVVIDVNSKTILHYHKGREQTQIASLTKLMTATLVLENIKNLDEPVTITPAMLNVCGTTVGCPTSVYCNDQKLRVGEKISVRNLLKAMLLDSANDAATALGIHVAGSAGKFVNMMNAKAKKLGLKDTHFCTPSGLEITGHENECYSSAYDVARIAAYSLKYNLIWDIMRTSKATVHSVDGKYTHNLKNTDMLLNKMPNCIGGKTGFTPLAGKSLMLGAVSPVGKHRIIAVILDDPNRWDDMKNLINWTFNNYQWR